MARKNEEIRTSLFMSFAFFAFVASIVVYWTSLPPSIDEFELIGQPFFEDFQSSSQATSLRVTAAGENGEIREFSVKRENEVWTIPSHHDYPAEAVGRLATTSSRLIGLKRDALAGRLPAEHPRFGVMDPESESIDSLDSIGKRITLRDQNDDLLADLIIGKPVEDIDLKDSVFEETVQPFFYVRRPDENQTFVAHLELDLSTRFSDWIDPNLLHLQTDRLVELDFDNYSVVEEQQRAGLNNNIALSKQEGEKLKLSKNPTSDEWTLAALDQATEELNIPTIRNVAKLLNQLTIVGVRPKTMFKGQQILSPKLEINRSPELLADMQGYQDAMIQLEFEMGQNGFPMIREVEDGKPKLAIYCKEGELAAGTSDGIRYSLMFGNTVVGDNKEIEIGNVQLKPSTNETTDSENEPRTLKPIPNEAENRFLMVQVSFDESLLGQKPNKPVEPIAPEKPDGYSPIVNKPDNEQSDTAPPPTQNEDRPIAFAQYERQLMEYESKLDEFEIAQLRFPTQLQAWEQKKSDGQRLANELQARFGKWYYVITASNLNDFKVTRSKLVKPRTESKLPERPNIDFELDKNPPVPQTNQ